MKAILWTAYGPPEVLVPGEVEKPRPGDDDVLIRIRATSVTAGDCEMRNLTPAPWIRLPMRLFMGWSKPQRVRILGQEWAGDVEAVGANVTRLKPGEAVFGATDVFFGAYAEYICLSDKDGKGFIAHKPAQLSYAEAAVTPTGASEAMHFIGIAKQHGVQHLLILGAGGSIGTYALQLAKQAGMRVTAIDRPEKFDVLRSLGADHLIDYAKTDFTKDELKYDAILDVPGKAKFWPSLRVLKPGGLFLSGNPTLALLLFRGLLGRLIDRKIVAQPAARNQKELLALKQLLEDGQLHPVMDRSFPLEQAAAAHAHAESGLKQGNIPLLLE